MNIPSSLVPKVDDHQVRIGNVTVTVHLTEHPLFVSKKLQSFIFRPFYRHVVGLDIQFDSRCSLRWLLLYTGNCCLKFYVPLLDLNVPASQNYLNQFLSDKNVIFVGHINKIDCKYGMELSFLAARVLKKPNMLNLQLEQLAGEVGLDVKPRTCANINWCSRVFLEDDFKYAIHNAFHSYAIGNKALTMGRY
ncbi:hypothetical protein UlMin_029055 [Ulmus minor]